ncbi:MULTISPECIES: spore germination protein [Bacillaceae]|uniref:Spore gernimation protein XB n=1 Tax=Gottfriedia luciferensis TaxID=178774 RepID=A0ABX2ZMM5_9BACI|nr:MULTISPECIES: spore germination protein [Bacillaceae]ODG90961.1 spore gernimation protein XB [Gottfriedia luciferensis]PGZ94403.1 spore germination protein [Bacillus sp. AFS029533]
MKRNNQPDQDQLKVKWDEDILRGWFEGSQDVIFQKHQIDSGKRYFSILSLYCQSLIDIKELRKTIMPHLHEVLENGFTGDAKDLESKLDVPITFVKSDFSQEDLAKKIFEGEVLFFLTASRLVFSIKLAMLPARSVEAPSTEVTLRGGRDGFVEEIQTNIGLIRKRLKTCSLSYEEFVIGTRSKTRVVVLYLKDVISQDVLEEVRSKLNNIKVDGIVSSDQIEELITERPFSLFPLLEYTGRPDYAVNCLLYGRFVLLVEGSPTASIGPVTLVFFVNNAEDQHSSAPSASLGRVLRIFSLIVAVFLPGFWIALVAYHPDQIPYTLLATLALSREGVPFPTTLEGFLMIFLFELLREAGLRIPTTVGQTLSVVGGLIIGQAAISAGLASPGIVVMMAISVVSTFTLINQSLSGTLSILRYFVYLLSSLLGITGLIFSVFIICVHLVNLRSFGVPFMAPYSPLVPTSLIPATIRIRFKNMIKRPKEIHTNDSTKKKGEEKR